jgi:hypothetical protein
VQKSRNSPHNETARVRSDHPEIERAFFMVIGAFADDRRVVYGGGRGFGSKALKIGGKLFAMISAKGKFVAKLPCERVESLVSQGIGEYFNPGTGRSMREWIALEGRSFLWIELAKEARSFVARDLLSETKTKK